MFKIVSGFIISVVVARTLGPEGNGYVAYFILVFKLLADYGHLGIITSTSYFQKRSQFSEFEVFNVNVTFLLISAAFISGVILLGKFLNVLLHDYNIYLIIVGILFVLSSFLMNCAKEIYIGSQKIVQLNKYIVFVDSFKLCLVVIFWYLNILTVSTYIFLLLLHMLLTAILLVKELGLHSTFKFNLNRALLKEELKFGLIVYLGTLFIYLNYRADQFFVKHLLGVNELGVYTIAVLLAELVFLIPLSIKSALKGKLFNVNNASDPHFFFSRTFKYTFYLCTFLVVVGIFMTPLIPIVYGAEFASASNIVLILFLGVIFASVAKISAIYLFTQGKPLIQLLFSFAVFLNNIVLNITLIPKLGLNGAAISSTISYTIYGVLYIYYFIRFKKLNYKDFFFFDDIDKKIMFRTLYTFRGVFNYKQK